LKVLTILDALFHERAKDTTINVITAPRELAASVQMEWRQASSIAAVSFLHPGLASRERFSHLGAHSPMRRRAARSALSVRFHFCRGLVEFGCSSHHHGHQRCFP
jgi:hypothetical protein